MHVNGEVEINGIHVEKVEVTNALLGISGSYVGQSVDGLTYNRLTGFANANVSGTIKFEHSDDGVTWYGDTTQDIVVGAGTTKVFSVTASSSYIRSVFTNGATAQATFIFTVYKRAQ